MGMTHSDKIELAREVKHMKDRGYSKIEAIEKLHRAYLWKKRTINVYWKVFNEDEV